MEKQHTDTNQKGKAWKRQKNHVLEQEVLRNDSVIMLHNPPPDSRKTMNIILSFKSGVSVKS